jgi:hypothetical protein
VTATAHKLAEVLDLDPAVVIAATSRTAVDLFGPALTL